MKKTGFLAAVLSLVMICKMVPSLAAETAFLFQENFNSGVTNGQPAQGEFFGFDTHLVERVSGADKAVYLKTLDGLAKIGVKTEAAAQKFVFSLDFKMCGARPALRLSVNGAPFVIGREDGALTTHDGCPVSSVARNAYTNLALAVDAKNKTYSVYVDGRCAVADWYVRNMSIAKAETAEIQFLAPEGRETEVFVDNLFLYEGEYRDTGAFASGGYNPASVEYVPQEAEEESHRIYTNLSFEGDAVQGLSLVPKSNKITVEAEQGRENHYLLYQREGTEDLYTETSLSDVSSYVIVQADYKLPKGASMGITLQVKDADGKGYGLLKAAENVNMAGTGTKAGSLSDSKWTNVAVAVNLVRSTLSVYIDGVQTVKDQEIPGGRLGSLSLVRFYCDTGSAAAMLQDNVRIYDGKTPRELGEGEKGERRSKYPPDAVAQKRLKNAVALHERTDCIYYGNEKHQMAAKPYYQDGALMVPLKALAEAYQIKTSFDGDTGAIRLECEGQMRLGSKEFVLKGEKKPMQAAPQVKDGILMVPLKTVCEDFLGKQVTWYERGLYVMTSVPWSLSEDEMLEVGNYILYDRPKEDTLRALMEERQTQRPRVILNPSSAQQIVSQYRNNTNRYIKSWGDTVISTVDQSVMNAPPAEYVLPDGYRLLDSARKVYNRSLTLSMAYLLTGDPKYAERLWTELETAGNFPDWNPQHYLDVSEMTAGFAIGYDWLYDVWTQEQRAFLEQCIHEKSLVLTDLSQYGELTVGGWWADETNNWNAVCNSGAVMGASAVFETDPELCARITQNSIRGLESMLNLFFPLGAWEEGATYWDYAMIYFAYLADTLENTFGSTFRLLSAPGLDTTVNFAVYSSSSAGADNFHDAEGGAGLSAVHYWLAKRFGQPDIARLRLFNTGGVGGVGDMLWFDTSVEPEDFELPLDTHMASESIDYCSMRGSWTDKSAPYLSMHAGKALVSHGHLDLGTYVLDMLGERWAVDLGSDDYNLPGYFGVDQRYTYYRLRPEGHNTLVINPDGGFGQNIGAATAVERTESKERGAYVIADLSEAYSDNAASTKRGYRLDDDRRSVILRDEITLKKKSEIYWFSHTKADIELLDEKTALLSLNGKKVKVSFLTNAPDFSLSVTDAVPLSVSPNPEGQKDNSGTRKLCAKFGGEGTLYLQAKWIPLTDPAADTPQQDIPLAQWSIPDGEKREIPIIDMLYMNGEPLKEFDPTVAGYSVTMPLDAREVPQVSAEGTEAYEVAVQEAKMPGETTYVRVTDREDPQLYRVYSVDFPYVRKLEDVAGRERLPVFALEASEEPEKENIRDNVSDGDLKTRWAASGANQWVTLDLGSPQQVSAVGVAGWQGGARVYSFDVAVSDDNQTWTTVVSKAQTSGTAERIEIFEFAPVTARYVRYIGNGNSVNAWNSILEFAALQ